MVRLYAHRGAAAEQPENTLSAFRRALQLGADALETDAWLTRDGQVVISHDGSGQRMTGVDKRVCSCDLTEVRSWDAGFGFVDGQGRRPFAGQGIQIPTLEELLGELPGASLNVDLKDGSLAMIDAVLSVVRRAGAEDRVLLASFSSRTLRRLRRRGWRGPTGMGQASVAWLAFAPMRLLRLFPPGGTRAQLPVKVPGMRLATETFIARCHAAGLAVDFWTINDPCEALRIAAMGADGIMTDDPATMAPALGKGPVGSKAGGRLP
jgi:glycerophosphoryl diester phosphodiesterase